MNFIIQLLNSPRSRCVDLIPTKDAKAFFDSVVDARAQVGLAEGAAFLMNKMLYYVDTFGIIRVHYCLELLQSSPVNLLFQIPFLQLEIGQLSERF